MSAILLCLAAYLLQRCSTTTPPLIPTPSPVHFAPRARRRRRSWTKNWFLRIQHHGNYDALLQELHREDKKGYKNFMRMSAELFNEMVDRLSPILKKDETRMRKPLPVGLKLAVTLRFLAIRNSFTDLQYSFRMSKSAISIFIPQVCKAIRPEVLKCPQTPDE